MHDTTYNKVNLATSNLTEEYVHFSNTNLSEKTLLDHISPLIIAIQNRIQSAYKSHAAIGYLGARLIESNLMNHMQFDDVCVKLLHIESGTNIFITLGSRLVRTLLIRLLSTSLIDENSTTPLSPTEKGIFSFIIAGTLFDAKNYLTDKIPNFKIMGIYNNRDEALTTTNNTFFGLYNFSLTFAHSIFPVSLAIPSKIFSLTKTAAYDSQHFLTRCGHISWPLVVPLKNLSLCDGVEQNFRFGDLIMFDRSENNLTNNVLRGPVFARWQHIVIAGHLDVVDGRYQLMRKNQPFSSMEDTPVEELLISNPSESRRNSETNQNQLANLAKNIRVPLSIELSRIPMTLREICALKDGEIIDLHKKIDEPLEMVVEGKVIGYCQPVQIDQRLGIRILEIIGDDSPKA